MNGRQVRFAHNESLFREVNERIAEVNDSFEVEGRAEYLCECGHRDCTESIGLTPREYEAVRAVSTQFIILPGHEDTGVEQVVQNHGRYLVVAKLGEAAEEARDLDPRTGQSN